MDKQYLANDKVIRVHVHECILLLVLVFLYTARNINVVLLTYVNSVCPNAKVNNIYIHSVTLTLFVQMPKSITYTFILFRHS
jgi:hypothetical protein